MEAYFVQAGPSPNDDELVTINLSGRQQQIPAAVYSGARESSAPK